MSQNINKKHTRSYRRRSHLMVVPQAGNQYRPYLIRRFGLLSVAVVVVAIQMVNMCMQTGQILGATATITPSALLEITNRDRKIAGAGTLTINARLSEAAYDKAQDMFKNQYWAHTSPQGVTPWKWLGDAGYDYAYAGENLAKNFTSTDAVMTAWMNSASHRSNILKAEYTDVGFAVVDGVMDGQPTSLVVALYGAPAQAVVQGAKTASPLAVVTSSTLPSQGTFIEQIGESLQSLSPLVLGNIVLLLFTASIALLAHTYRRKLPMPLRHSWYRHHGAYKAAGLIVVVVIVLGLYTTTGQI